MLISQGETKKMCEKRRKLWINAREDGTLDNMSMKECENLAGFYYLSDDDKWEVVELYEGEGYTCETQAEAVSLSNQITIIGLLLDINKK